MERIHLFLHDRQSKLAISLLLLSGAVSGILFYWCQTTNSLALQAFVYLVVFDILSLSTCLLTVWVSKQKPSSVYSFGYERLEVVSVFTSTILIIFSGLSVIKHGLEHLFEPPEINTTDLPIATLVGLGLHLLVLYGVKNKAYSHVASSASSNWLQDAVIDLGNCVCSIAPVLSGVLVVKVNPLVLVATAASASIFITNILIDYSDLHSADAAAALMIAVLLCSTMYPLCVYSGKILLQTVPEHAIGQLNKCLREASTLDGVLEFRNEHFWTLSFGVLAGSLHVRVKRDANEQTVLAQITNKLAPHVSQLTVQVFKEDWSMPSVTSGISNPSIPAAATAGYVARAHGHIHHHHHHHHHPHHHDQHQTHSHGFTSTGPSSEPLVVTVSSPLQTPSQNVT